MTRAEMRRAAMALSAMYAETLDWYVAAHEHGAIPEEVGPTNERASWHINDNCADEEEEIAVEASILMSEAHRPTGHDGDGKDEL